MTLAQIAAQVFGAVGILVFILLYQFNNMKSVLKAKMCIDFNSIAKKSGKGKSLSALFGRYFVGIIRRQWPRSRQEASNPGLHTWWDCTWR